MKRRRDRRIEIMKLAEDWRKFQGEKRKRWRRWVVRDRAQRCLFTTGGDE